jgi:WD40 repeat protein/DNA-binding SARP family transcriptional activator/type II secretory pathway predicted ATPase ExeA
METVDRQAFHSPTGQVYGRAVRFQVLGPIEADAGNGPIGLGGPKQRAVLAHLLLRSNQMVPSAVLIEELWGDEPPDSAKNTLQSYVSHLRKALGDGRIEGRPPGYVLIVERDELDADRFDDLLRDARKAVAIDAATAVRVFDEALDLWRGPAFADLADEPSLVPEAGRLNELRLNAMEDRLDALLASGEHARVAGEAQSMIAHDPLRERLWGQLMLALYRAGRQAEALAAFQRAREVLSEELGVDPSPELVRLHERVLRQDPGLDLRGEPLRGYRLLERIDDGPHGVVYRAIQPHVGRDVAVKVLHARLAGDPEFVRRFEPDAQAVAALEHPHIAPIHDYWREPGTAYVVARYLRGGSLAALGARAEPPEPAAAARMIEHVASALAFAHRQGVAHGNVTATNVLFDEEGNAYLSDFAIGAAQPPRERDDVSALAALVRGLFGAGLPHSLVELLERAEDGDGSLEAETLGAAVRSAFEPDRVPPVQHDARNPYKGLRAFSEADASDFFGREALTERLVAAMGDSGPGSRFLAVVGPSGSGKSSVVRAGLVPRLRGGAITGSDAWFVADMLPGTHPMEELEAALLRTAVRPVARLLDRLEGSSRGLLEAVDLVVPGEAELVLVVDQFEELFTLTEDPAERDLFMESLRVAITDPASRLRAVVTLRADLFDRPLMHPRFADLLGSRAVVVPPLTPDELEKAIARPAAAVGVRPEPGLLAEMVADVANQPGALPLVQYALTELFERRGDEGRSLTLAAYREIGGVTGALAARAEYLYQGSGSEGKRATKQLFLRLVTLGEGRQDTRRLVTREELGALDIDQDDMEHVLDAFGRHRLLTFDREPTTRDPTVEIAHEALLREWPRLHRWIDEARDDLRRSGLLSRAAAEWRGAERDPSFLLRGARLDQLEIWADATDLAVGRQDLEYLMASVAQRDRDEADVRARQEHQERLERRSRSRLRKLVAVLTVAALVASVLTLVAIDQRKEADRQTRLATVRELAAAATASLAIDPERTILLALQSIDAGLRDGVVLKEAVEALHAGIQEDRLLYTITNPSTGNVAWSPNGSLIATGGSVGGNAESDVMLWDARTGALVRRLSGHTGDISSVSFNPDGSLLLTTADDGNAIVWKTQTGTPVWSDRGKPGPASSGTFSADGRLLALGRADGVHLLETSDWREVRTFPTVVPVTPTLSLQGNRLFTGSQVFDVATGDHVMNLPYAAELVSPNGHRIAATAFDDAVHILDAESPRHQILSFPVPGGTYGLAWSPDGTLLATGGPDGIARVWEADSGKLLFDLVGHTGLVGMLAFSPDGNRLITGGGDGTARVWDVSREGPAEWFTDAEPFLNSVSYRPDGSLLMTTGWNGDGFAWTWDLSTGEKVRSYPFAEQAAFANDGQTLVSGPFDPRILDVSSGKVLQTMVVDPKDFGPNTTAYSLDGSLVAVGSVENTVTVWSASTGELTRKLGAPATIPEDSKDVAFSPEGELVATIGGRATLRVWDVASGAPVFDGQANSGQGRALAFSPNGTMLATAGTDGTIVWSVPSFKRITTLGAGGGTNDISFSADGRSLATVGDQGTTRIWSTSTWEETLVLADVGESLTGVALSPDGSTLATIGKQSTTSTSVSDILHVYALRLDDLIGFAERSLSRGFTRAECRQFLHVDACPVASPSPRPSGSPELPATPIQGPEGMYWATVAPDDVRGAGFPARENEDLAGDYSLSIVDGTFHLRWHGWYDRSISGTYAISGDRITFKDETDPWCTGRSIEGRWTLDGMSLSISNIEATDTPTCDHESDHATADLIFGGPWARLGRIAFGG